MNQTFRIGDAISYGFDRAKANWRVLSVFFLIVAAVNVVMSSLIAYANGQALSLAILQIVHFLISFYLAAALVKVSLVEADGARATWRDVWSTAAGTYWRFVWTSILLVLVQIGITLIAGLVFLIGAVLAGQLGAIAVVGIIISVIAAAAFVVASIYVSTRLKLATYSVVAGAPTISSTASVGESWRITRGNFWRLFGFLIVAGLVNLLGAIVVLVGLLFTLPLTIVATAYVYRKLLGAMPASSPVSSSAPSAMPASVN